MQVSQLWCNFAPQVFNLETLQGSPTSVSHRLTSSSLVLLFLFFLRFRCSSLHFTSSSCLRSIRPPRAMGGKVGESGCGWAGLVLVGIGGGHLRASDIWVSTSENDGNTKTNINKRQASKVTPSDFSSCVFRTFRASVQTELSAAGLPLEIRIKCK